MKCIELENMLKKTDEKIIFIEFFLPIFAISYYEKNDLK